jgi:hypothetical protein
MYTAIEAKVNYNLELNTRCLSLVVDAKAALTSMFLLRLDIHLNYDRLEG